MSEEALTGHERVVVTEAGSLDSAADSAPPKVLDPQYRLATAKLFDPAWQEVRDRVDPAEHEPGTHVATIYYDVEESWYGIDYVLDETDDAE